MKLLLRDSKIRAMPNDTIEELDSSSMVWKRYMSDYDSIQRIENMNVTYGSDRVVWYEGADSERPTRVVFGIRKIKVGRRGIT